MDRDANGADQTSAGQACRACGKQIRDDAPEYPFCSVRCRQADLGAWFTGKYVISREIKDTDLEESE